MQATAKRLFSMLKQVRFGDPHISLHYNLVDKVRGGDRSRAARAAALLWILKIH